MIGRHKVRSLTGDGPPALPFVLVCIACSAGSAPETRAQDTELTTTTTQIARSLAQGVCEQMDPKKHPALPFDADPTHAVALQSADKTLEVVVVPARGLRDDPDDPFLSQDRGVAVGYFRMRGLAPTEALPALDKFFPSTAQDTSTALVGVLSIQKLSSSEFRLQLWGKSDVPLAAVGLIATPWDGDGAAPVRIRSFPGLIECTWLGKYRAYLPVDIEPKP